MRGSDDRTEEMFSYIPLEKRNRPVPAALFGRMYRC